MDIFPFFFPRSLSTLLDHSCLKVKGNKSEFDKDEDKLKSTNSDRKNRFQKKIKTADDEFMSGSIINNSGNQLFLPKSLSTRYCYEFLDDNDKCKQKKN